MPRIKYRTTTESSLLERLVWRSHRGYYFMKMKMVTGKMIEYMQILFNDCNFSITQRNAWLTDMFKRPIKHLDELLMHEGHTVIDTLKEFKQGKKPFYSEDEIKF